jgi:hypothetical protein
VLEAGKAIGRFSSRSWIGTVAAPTSVVITMRDSTIPVRRQLRMLQDMPGAVGFRVDADHDAVVNHADRFVPVLLAAIESVVERTG